MKFQIIEKSQSEEVAKLAVCLTNEIIERTGIKHFDVDVPLAVSLCDNYVSKGLYNVIAAYDQNEIYNCIIRRSKIAHTWAGHPVAV